MNKEKIVFTKVIRQRTYYRKRVPKFQYRGEIPHKYGLLEICNNKLNPLIGKKVKVTIVPDLTKR